MSVEKHPITKSEHHVLRRVRGSKTVFQCADPTCTWRENKVFLINKMATCYRCGEDFVLDSYALSLSRPHCQNCTKGAAGRKFEEESKAGQKLLERLGVAS